jgi:hypothetical protein
VHEYERPPPEGPVIRVTRRSRQFGELARLISAFPQRPAECVRVTGELGHDENTDGDPAIDI